MRLLLLVCWLMLVAASCTPEGDVNYNTYNNYYPEDTIPPPDTTEPYSVQVSYPARNEVIEITYDWIEPPNPSNSCHWGYRSDTTIYAEVTTDIPDVLAAARVFWRYNTYGDYDEYSFVPYPASNSFRIPVAIFNYYFTSNMPNDMNVSFWVSVMTEDSTNYASPTMSFSIVSRVNYDTAAPPLAQPLDTLFEPDYQQRMDIYWCQRSPNVDSIHVAIRADNSGDTEHRSFPGNNSGFSYRGYQPLEAYSVWITASNSYGVSPASDTLHLVTREPVPVDNLAAISYSDGRVIVTWSNNSFPDSLLVARRGTSDSWATIKALACQNGYCVNNFEDSTAVTGTLAYYRIGLQYENGTWWSPDSVGAWIP